MSHTEGCYERRGTKYLFTGKELDDSTGLYDYGARQYDSNIGRFISADSLQWEDNSLKIVANKSLKEFLTNPQRLNRYSYCLDNPINYVDLYGFEPTRYWAEGEKEQVIKQVIGEDINNKEFVYKYTPSIGTDGHVLFQLEADTNLGKTDIDWALTLTYLAYETNVDTALIYPVAKRCWAKYDEGGKKYKEHMSNYGCSEEKRAIIMARELWTGKKKFKDFFSDLKGDKKESNTKSSKYPGIQIRKPNIRGIIKMVKRFESMRLKDKKR